MDCTHENEQYLRWNLESKSTCSDKNTMCFTDSRARIFIHDFTKNWIYFNENFNTLILFFMKIDDFMRFEHIIHPEEHDNLDSYRLCTGIYILNKVSWSSESFGCEKCHLQHIFVMVFYFTYCNVNLLKVLLQYLHYWKSMNWNPGFDGIRYPVYLYKLLNCHSKCDCKYFSTWWLLLILFCSNSLRCHCIHKEVFKMWILNFSKDFLDGFKKMKFLNWYFTCQNVSYLSFYNALISKYCC